MRLSAWAIVGLLAAAGALTDPARSGELPVETFFRNPEYRRPRLSPSGRLLACLSPQGSRVGLAVVDLDSKRATWAFLPKDGDVRWFRWVGDGRLLVLGEEVDAEFGRYFAVDPDGRRFLRLDGAMRFYGLIPGSDREVRVEIPGEGLRGNYFTDLARLDVRTGSLQHEVRNPGQVRDWVADADGLVRAGWGLEGDHLRVVFRAGPGKPWETLARWGTTQDGLTPLAFSSDGQSLYVLHGGGANTLGLYRYDLARREPVDLMFRHEGADVESVVLHPSSHALLGVTYETDRSRIFWVDEAFRRTQAAVDSVLTNTANGTFDISRDGSRLLLFAGSDRDPGTFYLVRRGTKIGLEKLFETAPWIPLDELAEMRPVRYQARDGLTIHGYLTRPKGSGDGRAPLVVNLHGGPSSRDSWGFDPEVQFLANRGYAVLQVNFRGSSGYGGRLQRAGDREWGRKMQDDVTDGVRWAIAQGIADPDRVAIMGASYGGYAALAGLVFTPDLYRCGVCLAGPVDLDTFLKQWPTYALEEVRASFTARLGDAKRDRERLEAVSPLNCVDRIRAPVFLAYGGKDPKVPVSQGKQFAAELKKKGKPYELLIKDDEGHGFFKEENRLEYYQRVDAFLKTHLRP
jgi:dipeptidyl aminopeptidase/acylaminoacyl peptidase